MYDLNLSLPNITSPKYSDDKRFILLKNYLTELNEVLSFALSDKTENEIKSVYKAVEAEEKSREKEAKKLTEQSVSRFNSLKEQIIRTAEEIEKDYLSEITKSETEISQRVAESYTTKSEFGEYTSQAQTEIKENADEINLLSEKNEEVEADLENFKSTARSEITLQSEAILTRVEENFLLKTEAQELESSIGSQITQTVSDITESFHNTIEGVSEDVSSVGGQITELVSSLDVYIRRGELESGVYGIEIGRSDSNIKARFTNDRLSFYQGISEVAYISGSTLYITNADILDYLRIGNTSDGYFLFDTTENGLEVRWINGN